MATPAENRQRAIRQRVSSRAAEYIAAAKAHITTGTEDAQAQTALDNALKALKQ